LPDASGNNHTGTISGATWSTEGHAGGALSFDGVDDIVDIADSAALDITRMTLSAWVKPTLLTAWRTVLLKEVPNGLAYGLYANEAGRRPTTWIRVNNQERESDGVSVLVQHAWNHLAATFDGTTLRLFVNGTQVSSRAVTGDITTSASPLRLGGNAVWGEYFGGLMDDVRIYNRPLSVEEIQADMNAPVTP
jgi:hypothetical protein